MTTLTITHSHAEGTMLSGSQRGDGAFDVLRPLGWRWWPSIRAVGLPQTRDRVADRARIDRAAEALRAAGHTVTVTIDDTHRARADVLADQVARTESRRDRLAARAERHRQASDAAHDRADALAGLRPLGQPIIVGHHSERRARADQRRIERAMDRAVAEGAAAAEYQRRAAAAGSNLAYAQTPRVTARRIRAAEAEMRRIDRALAAATGDHRAMLTARRAQLDDQLGHDRARLDAAAAAGHRIYGPQDVHVGDRVMVQGRLYPVRRVNRLTVSVDSGYGWDDRVDYDRITGVVHGHD